MVSRRAHLALALWLCITTCGCVPSCQAGGPVLDTCEDPGDGKLEKLELGAGSSSDPGSDFVTLSAGDGVHIVQGIQGANMIILRLRLHGASLPSCVAVQIDVRDNGGSLLSSVQTSLRTYADPAQSGVVGTSDIYFPGNYNGGRIVVTAAVLAQSVMLPLQLVTEGCTDLVSCSMACGSDETCFQNCMSGSDVSAQQQFYLLDSCHRRVCGDKLDGGSGATSDMGANPPRFFCLDYACESCTDSVDHSQIYCPADLGADSTCGACASENLSCQTGF